MEDGPALRLPQIEHAVVEPRVHLGTDLVRDRKRERRGRGAEQVERRRHELPPVSHLGVRLDNPAHGHDALADELRGVVEESFIRLFLGCDLERATPLADDEEGDPAEVSHVLDATRERDFFPVVPTPERGGRAEDRHPSGEGGTAIKNARTAGRRSWRGEEAYDLSP